VNRGVPIAAAPPEVLLQFACFADGPERRLSMMAIASSSVPAAILVVAVLLASVAFGQATDKTSKSPVRLNVLVTDKSNNPVMDLNQEDFLVLDEGKPQTLSFFEKRRIPVSYGLIVDNTGSSHAHVNEIIQAATTIVEGNSPEDQTFILRLMEGTAQVAVDWTSDKAALLQALSTMKDARGQMSLIDPIYACSEVIAKRLATEDVSRRRRAVIVISDGLERGSSKKMSELFSLLHKANIQIFAIGITRIRRAADLADDPYAGDASIRAANFLSGLTEETGGRAFFPATNSEMKAAADLIANCLRNQYIVGFDQVHDTKKGPLRKVRVRLLEGPNRDKYSVGYRKRYALSST
jgi:Ca-activated chloride channel homolog